MMIDGQHFCKQNAIQFKQDTINDYKQARQTDKHLFNSLFSRTTWVSQNQKRKTNLDFNEATDDRVIMASARLYANHLHLTPDR